MMEWFTHAIRADGGQICAIRSFLDDSDRTVLTARDSDLLHMLLNNLAEVPEIPFFPAKQAVLRAFHASANGAHVERILQ